MFKKIGIVSALSTALLFGGAFQHSVDASAKADQAQSPIYSKKVYYSINGKWQEGSWENWESILNKYLPNWGKNIHWNIKKEQPKQEIPAPQPKPEQPKKETPAPQPKPEQPKKETPAPQPKPEQPKKETPAPQPKPEQPKQEAPAPQPKPTQPKQEQPTNEQHGQLSQFEIQVVELTNNERAKQGLAPLKIDTALSKVAREKSRDMAVNGYFDHNSPTYGSPFDMMRSYGISYRTAGENIAKGQRTPQEVVTGWMNSPGHRANILNGNYTHIGVGYVKQGNHWTQQFIGK
ncbi:CAP domain-containing protein [Virgibacillus sp. W0430]|uniref:CAP domain-containing protein n=1 Tax=Virgibacillus sp. W0430 TaxID=3391580 RepID=UPI003F479B96